MLAMEKIQDVRFRYFVKGEKTSQIATDLGLAWKTVQKYIDMNDFNEPAAKAGNEVCNFWENGLAILGKTFCNFVEKVLAKNTHDVSIWHMCLRTRDKLRQAKGVHLRYLGYE
jgi:hypothetical protein